MHKQKTRVKKLAINKVLIIMGIICTIFAVAIVLLPLLSNGEIELLAKSGSKMKENYATTETNTWDVSENGDGTVVATLNDNGLFVVSGKGEMKNFNGSLTGSYGVSDCLEYIPWYSIREQIKKVRIEDGVTRIGECAFAYCGNLTQVEISNTVTSIEYSAFYRCISLTNTEIPVGVTTIGSNAFLGCNSLTNIEIPSGVTSINSWTFSSCINLKNIEVADDNTKYCDENGVLYTKDKKEILTYPAGKGEKEYEILSSVTAIKEATFYGCSNLENVKIPEGVTSIGNSAFWNCSKLASIEMPEGITRIEKQTFLSCSKLASIKIPSKVTSIGTNAFKSCSSLTSIEILDSVTSIGDGAFNYCEKLTSIKIPNGVTSIGNYTFSVCSSLTNVEIPDSVTTIGTSAFHTCSSLGNIKIPNKVTSIGQDAFIKCSKLTSIEIPKGVTSIGNHAFNYCTNLTEIKVNENNEKYCDVDGVLYTKDKTQILKYPEGKKKTEYEILSEVTSIGESAFQNCSVLTKIEIPEGVTSINGRAFKFCSSLRNIEIPSSVTSIGFWVFNECSSLTNIEVNENNKEYCDENGILYTKDKTELIAYPNGKEETEYELPSSVTNIKRSALVDCENLINIKVNENNEEYCDENGVLFTKDKKKLVIYPKGKQAEEYKIPNDVTIIGKNAFGGSILKVMEIPNTITSISSEAFYDCTDLTSIKIPSSVIYIDDNAFDYCDNLTIICKNDTTAETYAKENEIKYVIIMDGVKPKTTVSEVKAKLQTELQCEIVDLEERAVTDESTIGTGYKVKMLNGEEYSIIVWGDFTGDGKVSVAELARASRAAAQENGIEMKDKLILDVSGDGNIKINDLAAISKLATE